MNRHPRIRIGISGWNYADWRGRFYPKEMSSRQFYEHYAAEFDTVEINNSFYHLPTSRTFDEWNNQAPRDFIYSVKANRFITHMKKLKNAKTPVRRFLGRARRLCNHLGPILYQLPPRWKPNRERLKNFCAQLPGDLIHAIEFRERAWLNDEIFDVLRKHRVCLCIHDMLKRHPRRITGQAVYIRFHGAGSKYGGSYSRRRLRKWSDWIREAANDGYDVYAYFNNDRNAAAVRNARTLRKLLGTQ